MRVIWVISMIVKMLYKTLTISRVKVGLDKS